MYGGDDKNVLLIIIVDQTENYLKFSISSNAKSNVLRQLDIPPLRRSLAQTSLLQSIGTV